MQIAAVVYLADHSLKPQSSFILFKDFFLGGVSKNYADFIHDKPHLFF